MRRLYPALLLGLATSSMLCGEAHAQLVVATPDADAGLGAIEGTELSALAADAANAVTDAKGLAVITEKEIDSVPPPNPDPIATAATLQEQLVTPTPTGGIAAELDAANTAEATANATAGGGGATQKLAIAENLDNQALTALDNMAAQELAEDAENVKGIGAAPNEEALLAEVASVLTQVNATTREAAEMAALSTIAVDQAQINEAKEAESEKQDHTLTAALIDVSAAGP